MFLLCSRFGCKTPPPPLPSMQCPDRATFFGPPDALAEVHHYPPKDMAADVGARGGEQTLSPGAFWLRNRVEHEMCVGFQDVSCF